MTMAPMCLYLSIVYLDVRVAYYAVYVWVRLSFGKGKSWSFVEIYQFLNFI